MKTAFTRYADFSGRSTRSAYWKFLLASIIISYLLAGVDYLLFGNGPIADYISLFSSSGAPQPTDFSDVMAMYANCFSLFNTIWTIIIFIPGLAFLIRRLHDAGKSGWNILWYLLPCGIGAIVVFYFLVLDSERKTNKWGASEKYPEEV